MAERTKMGLDVDDCLLRFIVPFLEDYNEIYGTDLRIPTTGSYSLEETYGVPVEADWGYQIDRFFAGEAALLGQEPLEAASVVVDELAQYFDLVAVTARDRKTEELTRHQVQRHFGNSVLDVLMPTPDNGNTMKTNKGRFCVGQNIEHLVDDADHNILSAAALGVQVVSFGDIYYNRLELPPETPTADSWLEVQKIYLG